MKKLLIMFACAILMSSFALAATLSISPGTLELNGKANKEVCNKIILKYSSSESLEGTDLWASEGTEKILSLYNLKAEDLGITITYLTQVYLNADINKEITVCLTAQNQGVFQGALYFVPVSSSGNQAPGVGTWLSVNIQGVSDIPQFIANVPTTIVANQLSLEIKTSQTVNGNVNVVMYSDEGGVISNEVIVVGDLIDITADEEITNNLDSAVIKRDYDENELVSRNIDENTLGLYYYNPASTEWEKLDSYVNIDENYVQATITHFSIYGVLGSEIETEIENVDPDTDSPNDGDDGGGSPGDVNKESNSKRTSSKKDSRETGVSPPCREEWSCTGWSKCINSKQTRTCIDLNECGTAIYKPAESRSCTIQKTTPTPSTGHSVANPQIDEQSNVFAGILIIFSIVAVGLVSYLLIFQRRK